MNSIYFYLFSTCVVGILILGVNPVKNPGMQNLVKRYISPSYHFNLAPKYN